MPAVLGRAGLAVSVPVWHGREHLPHRPVHESHSTGQTTAGADAIRPRAGPALASGHPATGTGTGGRRHPAANIRVGYARCSHLTQELQSQLDALEAHGIPRDKIFSEKISTRVRVRPKFEAALHTCRQIKAHAPHCRVILTVNEMKRLGRDSAELTALADHLTAHGIVLEMLAGPLPGIYDPTGTGRILFAFFAAMAETDRENIREATLEGLNAAARKGNHGGRPPVITDDMLHTVLRRRASGESVEDIQPDLIIPIGKRKGRNPSVASIYRALAEHTKREAYPEAIEQAHADFATLSATT